MENKLNFGKSAGGIIKLPPGFRFQPTDKEIVFQYLARKIFSCVLPASIIPEINVCKFDPWDLPGDLEQDKYFFSIKEAKYRNGDRTNRTTSSGYWKSTGSDKQITCSSTGKQTMGMKKTLVFYRGKPPNACRTDWIMHEYRLVESVATAASNARQHMEKYSTAQNSVVQIGNWVVCHIFFRKRSVMDKDDEDEIVHEAYKDDRVKTSTGVGVGQPRFYDFMRRDLTDLGRSASSASSSDSSIITELSSTGSDREEINQLL